MTADHLAEKQPGSATTTGGAAGRAKLLDLVRAMPKAELHPHIEGTLEPELIFALAARNGVALPYEDVEALRRAYAFTDLQSFLDIYYAGAGVLLVEEDFFDMAMACLERAAHDPVVRAEMFFDPQTHTDRGVPMGTVIEGLGRAVAVAKERFGIDAALILRFLRHLDEEAASRTLEAALPWRDRIVGIGLDSGELGFHLVAHAGEEGPPDYIRDALDLLRVDRVDRVFADVRGRDGR